MNKQHKADGAEQIKQEWEAHDAALIECAKQAWASAGPGYDLHGWAANGLRAFLAYGTPPRAKCEYVHVFLFTKCNHQGTVGYHLVTIGKTPWHTRLTYRGTRLTSKQALVRSFPVGQFTARRPELAQFSAHTGA